MVDQVTSGSVLIIYMGGTIGSIPKDPADATSPLHPADIRYILKFLPGYNAAEGSISIGRKSVQLETYAWDNPLDSSNVDIDDWIALANVLSDHYEEYDGFVVLHGTDTMAYTASALSFMLENLSKPVILTGSQLPIGDTRSDAVQNLVTSITIAAARALGGDLVPEVCIFFRDELLRGCRATKVSASCFNAYTSPNLPPLGHAGEYIRIRKELVNRPSGNPLKVHSNLETDIASVNLFPGMSAALFNNMLHTKNLRGLVLQTFGTGNAPTTPDFLDAVGNAVARGKVLYDVTQCRSGEVELGLYEVSAGLLSRGVVSGMDITPEAALTKMAVVLGAEPRTEIAADLLQLNWKGEQRQSVFHLHFNDGKVGRNDSIVVKPSRPMTMGAEAFRRDGLEKAVLFFFGIRSVGLEDEGLRFKIYLDLPSAMKETEEINCPNYLGTVVKTIDKNRRLEYLFLTVTDRVRPLIEGSRKHRLTLVNMTEAELSWERIDLALSCSVPVGNLPLSTTASGSARR